MIAELATDLLAKIRTVPGLETSTSLSNGGRNADPMLLKATLPTTWVQFKADVVDEPDYTHGPHSGFVATSQTMMATFAALVLVGYTNDIDLLDNQYPLLDSIVAAVQGTEAPSGMNWRCVGKQLARVFDNRLAYELRFTVTFIT